MSINKVFAVTGATGKIGLAIARRLAEKHNHEVVLIVRSKNKAEKAIANIIHATGNPRVRFELADLSRLTEIQNLANRWIGPLHVLINNAACTPPQRLESQEGIEIQFATNVLGYFWLSNELTGILKKSAPARIINVASYWAGGLDLNDLEFIHRRYDNDLAYRQSKQANRMLSVAFAQQLKSYGITVNACHPGDVNSTLSNNLGFGGHESPEQGAETPVWLATQAIGEKITGKYFEHKQETRCRFSGNQDSIQRLFNACSGYT